MYTGIMAWRSVLDYRTEFQFYYIIQNWGGGGAWQLKMKYVPETRRASVGGQMSALGNTEQWNSIQNAHWYNQMIVGLSWWILHAQGHLYFWTKVMQLRKDPIFNQWHMFLSCTLTLFWQHCLPQRYWVYQGSLPLGNVTKPWTSSRAPLASFHILGQLVWCVVLKVFVFSLLFLL